MIAWTDARVATLRKVADEGGSYTDAAKLLGVTRNAIAGKAFRLGVRFSLDPAVKSERCRQACAARLARRA